MVEKHEKISNELKCVGCGAVLEFKPGSINLECTHCGAENVIEESTEVIEELDYKKFVDEKLDKEEKIEIATTRCPSCGATITLKPNVTSDHCPYCATSIVVQGGSTSTILKPKSLIPFKIDKKKALQSFRNWISHLWFAPSALKKNTRNDRVDGIYVPYWTYDSDTTTSYSGQRGEYRYRTETYTDTDEQGNSVTKTRQVRYTVWFPATGIVTNTFDDILVIASNSLPVKFTDKLEPWNLGELLPYDDKFLSGFRSESYQVSVTTGLDVAKSKMQPIIKSTIRSDIGGDEQRIHSLSSTYNNVTFKHVLLPLWISSYRFGEKVYRFLINGQTGEVQGERPYSAWKIAGTVLGVIAVIVIAILLFNK